MYFSNLYDFKGAARAVKRGLNALPQGVRITPEQLIPILFEIPQLRTKEQIQELSQKLAPAFNLARSPSINLTETQRILAKYMMGMGYEALAKEIAKEPLDFYELFDVPSNLSLRGTPDRLPRPVIHPFPKEFYEYKQLLPWKHDWELLGKSTREKTFFPPLPPFQCFPGKGLHLKTYDNWTHKIARHPNRQFNTANAGLFVLDQDNHIVAIAGWHFWGHAGRLAGNDFSVAIRDGRSIFRLSFDIRPYEEYPTFGPNISEGKISDRDDSAARDWDARIEAILSLPKEVDDYVPREDEMSIKEPQNLLASEEL